MIARLFSPTASSRLFDPMPLPKSFRARHRSRITKARKGIILVNSIFSATIKKIPQNK